MRIGRVVMDAPPGLLEFVRPGAPGKHPILLSGGIIRMAARAGRVVGDGAAETSSATIVLNNPMERTARLLDYPLRRGVNIFADDESLVFTGLVSAMEVSRVITLTIDA